MQKFQDRVRNWAERRFRWRWTRGMVVCLGYAFLALLYALALINYVFTHRVTLKVLQVCSVIAVCLAAYALCFTGRWFYLPAIAVIL
ncbi:MAG: hypothetical protein LBT97_12375, partial [Planctomycetota bacterium]|nr:hypothetical protein [Planctomycetota bacterium]